MRDVERIPIMLDAVRRLWERYPDWRLGQLIHNKSGSGGTGGAIFYIEDDELLRRIEEELRDA